MRLFPRVMWTVVERDGRAEFVIWRQWLWRGAYDINSFIVGPGRYDRETDFGRLDPKPHRRPSDPRRPAVPEENEQ